MVACPATATVMIACAAFLIGTRATRAEQWVNHTLEVREEIQKLRGAALEAIADTRGYLIGGDEVYSDRVRASLATFDTTTQRLVSLTADNPSQQQRLSQISDVERSRQESIYNSLARFRAGVLPAAELRDLVRASDVSRARMEALIRAMEERETNLLADRLQNAESLRAAMRMVTSICLLLGVVGGVIISLLFASGITNRIAKLSKNVNNLATGGALDPLPDGRDEIGALSEGVARTAEILQQRTAALEHALHGIAQVDGQGRYVSFNKAYAELTGLAEGNRTTDVLAGVLPQHRTQVEAALEQMRTTGRGETEARIVLPDQSVRDVAIVFLPVASGDPESGHFVFMRDITRRKEAEVALIHAKDTAVASTHARTKFLAKISHDIRTPLNAILGTADLLSQTQLNVDQADYVEMFQRNSRRLVALINDFLDFSKIEAGAMRVERLPFRLRPTVEDAVKTFRESAARKGLALQVEIADSIPEWHMGDPLRMQQILVNLLSNALKFTEKGRVDVRVRVTGDAGARLLRFEVADTGPGIPAANRDSIFSPFEQLPTQNMGASPGCGLGLAICRELAQMLDGEIGLVSEEGSGSTFYFSVPLVETEPTPQVPAHPTPERAFRRLRRDRPIQILIAEDTEDNRVLLEHYLKDEAVLLHFAGNGFAAVEAFRNGVQFDLVLMDMDMPVMDGCEATRQICELQAALKTPPTPIVALSAHAIHEEVRASLDAGCVAHVSKPVDQATLIETIQRYARPESVAGSAPAVREPVSKDVAALVPKYLAAKSSQIETARADLSAHEFDSIRRFGHNLKGTGRGYGFPEIEALGRELEESAKVADETSIARQLQALDEFVAEAAVSVADS